MNLEMPWGNRRTTAQILKPYRETDSVKRRFARWLAAPAVGLFCLIYGFAFGLLAPYLMVPLAAPLVVLAAIAIWALPDVSRPPTTTLAGLFWAYMVAGVLWPNYLAISLPGLPWITVLRLTGLPLAIALLICISASSDFRAKIRAVLTHSPPLLPLVGAFVLVQITSVFLSTSKFASMEKFIDHEISWTCIFFVSCYFFLQKGRIKSFIYALWAGSIALGILGMAEFKMNHTPWAGHIPSFLTIDDPNSKMYFVGRMRSGAYRIQGVFTNSLSMAEFYALITPFLIHFVEGKFSAIVKVLAIATLPFYCLIIFLTGARLGFLGVGLGFGLYAALWSVRLWRNRPQNVFGPALVLAIPAAIATLAAGYAFIPALRLRIEGSPIQRVSTMARNVQWQMGLPKILSQPWGYGEGRAADELGYHTPDGLLTIDTGYLQLILDYGIFGFVIYMLIMLLIAYKSIKTGVCRVEKSEDASFLLPTGVALVCYIAIKSVHQISMNQSLIFAFLGLAVATLYTTYTREKRLHTAGKSLYPMDEPSL